MEPNLKDTFCILPWIHLNVQPNGDVYPCCMAPYGETIGNTRENTLEEIWNNNHMKTIRKQMLKGERPHLCNRCFLIEDSGLTSPRATHNRMFEKNIEEVVKNTNIDTGQYDDFKLKYWDFRWSNICNFKCRMCGVYSSSKWAPEAKELHNDVVSDSGIIQFNSDSKENIFDLVDKFIFEVEEIYFAGGEPLVMEEHYLILEKLIAAGRTDVRLRYNTNFSHLKFKKWDLFGMWKKFLDDPNGGIELFASLDAVGKLAEVIRNGTKWDKVYQNVKRCIEANMSVHFSPTISLLNMFFINELVDVAEELNIDPDKLNMNNLLTSPPWYDIRIMPQYLKDELIEKLEAYRDNVPMKYRGVFNHGLKSWKSFITTEFPGDIEKSEKRLVYNTVYLDKSRDEDFLEVNPQFRKWFEDIKSKVTDPNYFKVPFSPNSI